MIVFIADISSPCSHAAEPVVRSRTPFRARSSSGAYGGHVAGHRETSEEGLLEHFVSSNAALLLNASPSIDAPSHTACVVERRAVEREDRCAVPRDAAPSPQEGGGHRTRCEVKRCAGADETFNSPTPSPWI